jgi:hypothetical protein
MATPMDVTLTYSAVSVKLTIHDRIVILVIAYSPEPKA